jgi:hypothetical protein
VEARRQEVRRDRIRKKFDEWDRVDRKFDELFDQSFGGLSGPGASVGLAIP